MGDTTGVGTPGSVAAMFQVLPHLSNSPSMAHAAACRDPCSMPSRRFVFSLFCLKV